MKASIILFCSILLIVSCTGNKEQKEEALPEQVKAQALDLTHYTVRNVSLINQLGVISIYLPDVMDTFFTYADFGEYRCGETKQYRFSSKKFSPSKESDFSYSDPTDTLYQLTIIQTYNRDCETNTKIDEALLKSMQRDKMHTYSMLEGRSSKFIVGVMEMQRTGLEVAEVSALTSVSGRMVKFVFQSYKKSSDDFTNKMLTSLKTVEIKQSAGQQ